MWVENEHYTYISWKSLLNIICFIYFCNQLDNLEDAVEFECNRWLDVKEDDGLIVREITAGGAQMLNSKYTSLSFTPQQNVPVKPNSLHTWNEKYAMSFP